MIRLLTKNNKEVPPIGLGTFPMKGIELSKITIESIKAGYKLIDTSDDYDGEYGIGKGVASLIKEGVCCREDVFLQTKVSNNDSFFDEPLRAIYFTENSPYMRRHSVEEIVREKVENSLCALQTDYLDSILIHFPYEPFYIEIWNVLIKLKDEGLTRYIGVSNFHPKHINRLITKTGIKPEINEIYLSAISVKEEQVQYANEKEILLMTYSPLMDLTHNRIPMDIIDTIAKKYNKSASQIILRWNIERGSIPLPKSSNLNRIKQNIDVQNFNLTQEEVKLISSLNRDYQYLPESLNCPGI